MVLCHIVGMDGEIDLKTADRDVLIAIIVRQQAIIERLEKRIAQLEGQAKPSGSGRMPGLKPKADRKPAQPKGPRKPRPHGFARTRMTPTQRVERAVAQCPDCGTQLAGGWTQRTREVIDLPQVPVQVTEHAYIARTCPSCQRRCVPPAQLDGVVLDKQRLGVNVMSLRRRLGCPSAPSSGTWMPSMGCASVWEPSWTPRKRWLARPRLRWPI